MDTEQLLKAHDGLIREWAGRAVRKHPITFDEAYGEMLLGFAQGVATWRPEGGAGLIAHCHARAVGAVKDYCRSLSFTPPRSKLAVKVKRLEVALDGAATLEFPTAAMESDEFWVKVYNVLYKRHRRPWLILNLLKREGWAGTQVAKYLGVTESAVSQQYANALTILRRSWGLRKWLAGERWGKPRTSRSPRQGARFDIPDMGACCMAGCDRPVNSRGMCGRHVWREQAAKLRRASDD